MQVQLPQTDPADYLHWKTAGGTGNYIAPAAAGGTPAPTAAAAAPPRMPADHAARTMCLACHATGQGGAPKLPTANPDHSAFKDDNGATLCLGCHVLPK